MGLGRRQGQARRLGGVRQFGGRPAGLPDDLRLQALARPVDRPLGRRHRRDDQGRRRTDRRRQRRHGLRHRRRDRALRPRRARRRQGRAAGLSPDADHPRSGAEGQSEDRRHPEADLRGPRPRHAAEAQRPRPGSGRAGQGGRRGLSEVEGLLEVSDCRRGGDLAPAARPGRPGLNRHLPAAALRARARGDVTIPLWRGGSRARSEIAMAASVARTAPVASLGLDKLGVVVAALLAIGAASPLRRVPGQSDRRWRGQALLRGAAGARRRAVRADRDRRRRRRAVEDSGARAARDGDRVRRRLGGTDRNRSRSPDASGDTLRASRAGGRLLDARFRRLDPVRRFRRAPEARPAGAPAGAGARRCGLRAGAVVRRLERIVDPQGICHPRRRVLARGRRASHSRDRLARRGDGGRPAARRADRTQEGIACARAQHAQRDPDDSVDRAVRHPDRAARLDLRPCARRRGARRPRHRRRAGVPRALSLFAAADDGQHGRRHRPACRATSSTPRDGMGMTGRQRLFSVELPLALPVILTGVRIVLVQNIGMATIAALIGGGGFGVFVFAGLGQTAPDLILLGALPTVFLAFAAAIVLDATVELVTGARP